MAHVHSAFRPKAPMRPFVVGSAVAHALVIAAAWFYSAFLSGPRIDLDQKPIQATLVRLGEERDDKLLPRIEEEPPPPPPEEEAPEIANEPEPPAEAIALPTPDVTPPPTPAPKKPKAEGTSDADRRKKLFGAFSKTAKKAPEVVEGRADGDALGDAAREEGERYWGLLRAQVRRHYDVAQTISERERVYLKAQVTMQIGRSGEVLAVRLTKASGNNLFDAAVVNAVKKAAPFSPPPEALRHSLQWRGVTLEFTP